MLSRVRQKIHNSSINVTTLLLEFFSWQINQPPLGTIHCVQKFSKEGKYFQEEKKRALCEMQQKSKTDPLCISENIEELLNVRRRRP